MRVLIIRLEISDSPLTNLLVICCKGFKRTESGTLTLTSDLQFRFVTGSKAAYVYTTTKRISYFSKDFDARRKKSRLEITLFL